MTRATFDPLGVHVVANESGTMCGAVDPSILAGERPTLGWHEASRRQLARCGPNDLFR